MRIVEKQSKKSDDTLRDGVGTGEVASGAPESVARDPFFALQVCADSDARWAIACRVAELATEAATSLQFRIVRTRLNGGRGARLQVIAERADGSFSVDDCALLSRALSPLLDNDDSLTHAIRGSYVLEVSSPGMERPLTRSQDFVAYQGAEVSLRLKSSHSASRKSMATGTQGKRKQYYGQLVAVEDGILTLTELGDSKTDTEKENEFLHFNLGEVAEVCLRPLLPTQTSKPKHKKHNKNHKNHKKQAQPAHQNPYQTKKANTTEKNTNRVAL